MNNNHDNNNHIFVYNIFTHHIDDCILFYLYC